uniref:Fatty-acid amide hydrolase 2 n=1 Tax=Parasteatoda tepidariorum TaxID=114398 RepID=A0A2L2YIK7_PARTP
MGSVLASTMEFIRIFLYFTQPYSDYVISFLYRIFWVKTRPVPPIENKLLLLSATELAEKIRSKQAKCEDVMRAYVDRCRKVQPYINAVTDARYEDALEESRLVDRFLARGDKTPDEIEKDTPLLGVPFSCKEAIGVKGLAQTSGIYAAKGRVADKDSDATAYCRAAGAIPVTVTNVPEMCMWWDTSNLIFGITKNPFDNSRAVGGSTGGEAALLTTAGAVIGIGNDLGGSIRIPSSFNGIYGHKPSTGVVSNKGDFPYIEGENEKLDEFTSTGPMCRYAKDLPLLLKILSNDDKRLQLNKEVDFSKVKVYYIEEFPGLAFSPTQSIKKAVRRAADFFEERFGTKAIPLTLNELQNSFQLWQSKVLEKNLEPFKLIFANENGQVHLGWEFLKVIFRLSNHTLPCLFYAAIEKRDKDQFHYDCLQQFASLKQKFLDIFQEDSIVLLPTHPEPPPFSHLTIPKFNNIGYTAIFNVLGFPVTNIPAGISDGLPIGLQAVSGPFKDHITIAAAVELDKLFGGWSSPCTFSIK